MKSDHGTFELDVTRDRNGSFEPEIVKQNQISMTGCQAKRRSRQFLM